MIQKNELRINNIILVDNEKHRPTDNGKLAKIISIQVDSAGLQLLEDKFSITTFGQFYKYLKPIELTDNWLIDFGFDKGVYSGILNAWENNKVVISFYDGFHYHNFGTLVELKYVHQLQNLFYSLTGVELLLP